MSGTLMVLGDVLDSINNNQSLTNAPTVGEVVQPIILMVTFLIGIITVIMIIVGGIQYSMSQGDSGKVKKAKDTILYGIIGLVVTLLAFSIVSFVLQSINSGPPVDAETEETEEEEETEETSSIIDTSMLV